MALRVTENGIEDQGVTQLLKENGTEGDREWY